MKKVFFVAAAALLMVGFTSCKEGKCACVGISTASPYIIQEEMAESGISNATVCGDIKAKYPNAVYIQCFEGKTLEEAKKEAEEQQKQ